MEVPCNRCGCNRPFHDQIEQAMQRNFKISQDYKRIAAANAAALAERDLKILDLQESQKWMQQKVKKQAAHLRRLEEKLKKLGKEPYDPD